MAERAVRRMRAPTREELVTKIVPASEPVIFEGAIDHWSLLGMPPKALFAKLSEIAGTRKVPIASAKRKNEGLFSYADKRPRGTNFDEYPQQFSEFLDDVLHDGGRAKGKALYMRSASLPTLLPELLPLFGLDMLAGQQLATGSPRLWIGTGGHRIALHFDRDDNLLCMVSGRKRLLMYPQHLLPNMYLGGFGLEPGAVATALVDPLRPDLERYPRFAEAQPHAIVAELAPGDTLYIPAHWWHHVESIDLNVAVTYWWCRVPLETRIAAEAAFIQGLLSLRTLSPYLREVYKTLFDYFVFETHGDPYAHIDEADQGWAGRPTPERERELHAKLRMMLAGAGLVADPTKRFVLAPGTSFKKRGERVEITGPFEQLVMPEAIAKIVKAFASPTAPRTLAKRRHARDAQGRDDLERFCRALVARGVLLPAD